MILDAPAMNLESHETLVMQFPGPPPTREHDDIAEWYAIVRNPQAMNGLMVFSFYRGEWHANPFNMRPVVQVLLERIAELES